MPIYQIHHRHRHHMTDLMKVGGEHDKLEESWYCLGDEDIIFTEQVEADCPRSAARTVIWDWAPMPPITYEAEGLIPVPPLDRVQARALCGTIKGAEGHEDGCLLYCAVAHDGTIVDQGTYDHVQPRLTEATTLMAVSSHDPGDPRAPLNSIWVPVRVHIPDITGPITALTNALESAKGYPMLLFDRYALLAYRDALADYNATVRPNQQVVLSLTVWREGAGHVPQDIATATVEDLTGTHEVTWPKGPTSAQLVGPVYWDEVLYFLPAPPNSDGWRWYDPCGVCADLGRRHPACRLCTS